MSHQTDNLNNHRVNGSSKSKYGNQGSSHDDSSLVDDPIDWHCFVNEELMCILRQMHQLNAYAREKNIDVKQFAVSEQELASHGCSNSQLRVLITEGVLTHLRETTSAKSKSRKFEMRPTLMIDSESCFVVNPSSEKYLSEQKGKTEKRILNSRTPEILSLTRPVWNQLSRRLEFCGVLVKHFRCPAQNQETILSAFQEEGWPERICDPLPPNMATDSKQRLHDAIRSLNRNQTNSSIRFGGDGTGEGVIWELNQTTPKLPTE